MQIKICRIVMLVLLYGCETWPLALKEERRSSVGEYGSEDDTLVPGATGGNSTLESFLLCRLRRTYPGDQIEKNEVGRACGTYRGEETFIRGFGGET